MADGATNVHVAFVFATKRSLDRAVDVFGTEGYQLEPQDDNVLMVQVAADNEESLNAAVVRAQRIGDSLDGEYLGYGGFASEHRSN